MTNISDWMKTWTGGDCSGGGDGGAERVIDIAMSDGEYYLMENGTEISASAVVNLMYTEPVIFQKDFQRSIGASFRHVGQSPVLDVILLVGIDGNEFIFNVFEFPLSVGATGTMSAKRVSFTS